MVKLMIGAGIDANAIRAGRGTGSKPKAVAPFVMTAPGLTGSGRIGTAALADMGVWGGEPPPGLSVRWQRDGVDIAGAAGASYTPGPADDLSALRCVVTAVNATGTLEVASAALAVTWEPPVSGGGLLDEIHDQDSGMQLIPTAYDFTGGNLSFSVSGAGAAIDPQTGVVSLPTDVLRSGEMVTVTAMNSGGAAQSAFPVTVEASEVTAPMGPPVLVPQSLRSTRLAVTLAAAPDAGGAAILGYDLRHTLSLSADLLENQSEDEVSWQVLSDAAPVARVTGLAPGRFAHLQSRAVTDAGPGPWSEALTLKMPATDMPVFHDSFSSGADGAAVNAGGRLPDTGLAWAAWGGGKMTLQQPAGTATHGGTSARMGSRNGRGMVFDGGYWAETSGTLEIDCNFASSTGERLYILFSARGVSDFASIRVRNHATEGNRIQLWVAAGALDGEVTSADTILPRVNTDAVNTIRLVRDGDALRLYLNNEFKMDFTSPDLPSGTLWGIGGDSLGNPPWVDNVRFYDVPVHVELSGGAQPPGSIVLDIAGAGVVIAEEV